METRLRHLAGYLIFNVIIVIAANTIVTIQNLSVILQRAYYKAGKRKGVKQRLFKRTPIHDHFRTSMSLIEPGCTVKFTKPVAGLPTDSLPGIHRKESVSATLCE